MTLRHECASEIESLAISNREVRALLNQRFPVIDDLDAFILDEYSDVYRQFSSGMNRQQKLNLLFANESHAAVHQKLRSYLNYNNRPPRKDTRISFKVILDGDCSKIDVNSLVASLRGLTDCDEIVIIQYSAGSIVLCCEGSIFAYEILAKSLLAGSRILVDGNNLLSVHSSDPDVDSSLRNVYFSKPSLINREFKIPIWLKRLWRILRNQSE